MHVYDVEDAVDGQDASGLQHAFQVLIDYPRLGHVEGVRVAAKLDELFEQVTSALHLDQAIMPDGTRRAIEHLTSIPFDPETSYAHAAIVAFEFREKWHALYRAEPPPKYRPPFNGHDPIVSGQVALSSREDSNRAEGVPAPSTRRILSDLP